MRRHCAGHVLGMAATLFRLAAAAGEPSANAELEKKVRELEKRLSEIERRGGMPARAPEKAEADFRVYWKDALRFETADKRYKFKLGGRLMNDWAFVDADEEVEAAAGAEQEDGVEFRCARIDISGVLEEQIEFRTEYDFAGGDADLKNVYIGLLDVPVVGNVRVGHFEPPFSLNKMTSNKYITFMERGLPVALVPGMDTGIMLHNRELGGRVSWAAGVFRDTDAYGDGQGEGYNLTARVTGLPWCEEEGAKLLHLGLDFCHRDPGEGTLRFRSRPEAHLVDNLVDTADLAANSAEIVGAEAAVVYGPLSLQAEYVHSFVDDVDQGALDGEDADFHGFYALASCFLTGEHRAYNRKEGAFGRVRPKRDFLSEAGGPGAWELAVRYSHLDLDEDFCDGGEISDLTVGLNWYLNPSVRIMWNYVFADLEDDAGDGQANVFQMRFQLAF